MTEVNENLMCNENCIHYGKINKVKMNKINREDFQLLSDIFKLLADETRLRIICCLLNEELCVCDLSEVLELNQSTVSHQLQLLRNSKLVKYRREGKQIFYSLDDEHIANILQMALCHIKEEGR